MTTDSIVFFLISGILSEKYKKKMLKTNSQDLQKDSISNFAESVFNFTLISVFFHAKTRIFLNVNSQNVQKSRISNFACKEHVVGCLCMYFYFWLNF